jgi:hypothetical protein
MVFLPWHRKFFIEVENRFQMALDDCSFTIPYWNWGLEIAHFDTANVWSANRIGSFNADAPGDSNALNEMCVKDGVVGSETASSSFGKGYDLLGMGLNRGRQDSDCIMRRGSKPSGLDYATVLSTLKEDHKGHTSFAEMTQFIETKLHNSVHGAVGGMQVFTDADGRQQRNTGHMTSHYSPYDPAFYLHHGYLDHLWKVWQDAHVDEANRMHRSHDMMEHQLFDGQWDKWYPVSDVSMSMDIIDDHPDTLETEKACVYYHDRKNGDEACADKWTQVQECLQKVVDAKRLHEVPRIKEMTSIGDVCSPLNPVAEDQDRMWLETLVEMGMMQKDKMADILKWEQTMNKELNGIIPALEESQADECDKALCFSTSKLLEICQEL